MMRLPEKMPLEKWLKKQRIFSQKKRRIKGDLKVKFKYWKNFC